MLIYVNRYTLQLLRVTEFRFHLSAIGFVVATTLLSQSYELAGSIGAVSLSEDVQRSQVASRRREVGAMLCALGFLVPTLPGHFV